MHHAIIISYGCTHSNLEPREMSRTNRHDSTHQKDLFTKPNLLMHPVNATPVTTLNMSLALHSMSRQHKDSCLDWLHYILISPTMPIQPSVLATPFACSLALNVATCGKILDPYGDHIFSCHDAHKKKLSNAIRDTLVKFLQVLAPLAGFTNSPDPNTIKARQYAPSDLQKRPANIGMNLVASYLHTNAISPA